MSDLSFETINDTDVNELDAIQPMLLGDDALPLNFNRPHDNMRLRTERARIGVNENAYLLDEATVYRMYASSDGNINWGGAWDGASPADPAGTASVVGAFVPSQDINIVSLISSGEARAVGDLFYGGGTPFSSTFAYEDFAQGAENVRVVSKLHAHEGGDWVTLEIVDGTVNLATPTVTVTGQAPLTGGLGFAPHKAHILVTLSDKSTDTNSIQSVMTAINGDPTAQNILEMYAHPTLSATLTEPAVAFASTPLMRGLNAVHMVITAGTFATFFGTNDNRLREGDCLAINHADLTIRRGRISEKGTTNIAVGSIFNLSRNPEKAGGSIPICRVIDGYLHLLSGARIETYASGFIPSVGLGAANLWAPQISGTTISLLGTTIAEHLQDIVTELDSFLSTGMSLARLGINQNPADGTTRLHITDTSTAPVMRLERTDNTLIDTDEIGVINFYGNDTGGTGNRVQIIAQAASSAGASRLVFNVAQDGALPAAEVSALSLSATGADVEGALTATDVIGTSLQKVTLDPVEGEVKFDNMSNPMSLNEIVGRISFNTAQAGAGIAGKSATITAEATTDDGASELVWRLRSAAGSLSSLREVMRLDIDGHLLLSDSSSSYKIDHTKVSTGTPTRCEQYRVLLTNAAAEGDGVRRDTLMHRSDLTALTLARQDTEILVATLDAEETCVRTKLMLAGAAPTDAMMVTGAGSLRVGKGCVDNDDIPYLRPNSAGTMAASNHVAAVLCHDFDGVAPGHGTILVLADSDDAASTNHNTAIYMVASELAGTDDYVQVYMAAAKTTPGNNEFATTFILGVNGQAGHSIALPSQSWTFTGGTGVCNGPSGGSFTNTSDMAFKENVAPLAGALDSVLHLSPVSFDWKADFIESGTPRRTTGFIAQEIKLVLPQVVRGTEYDPTVEQGPARDGLSVAYGELTPILAAATQELHTIILGLQERLAVLENA